VHGVVFDVSAAAAARHRAARQSRTLRPCCAYISASNPMPITSTTKPTAVAAANDRSTLSMMRPRCRRATFPPWLRLTVRNLTRGCGSSRAIGWPNWDVCGASLRPLERGLRSPSGTRKPAPLIFFRPVDQHRASIPARGPRSAPSGVFGLRARIRSAGLSGCRKPGRLVFSCYGVAAQHLSLQ